MEPLVIKYASSSHGQVCQQNGSGNLHTSVCDSRPSLTLCQSHNSPGESFSPELRPGPSLLSTDKGVILCLRPAPSRVPLQNPISHTMINSEGKEEGKD
ncbi:unnamed protein product [Pleuronectes platessa]|uniref:Uncharacterized protein n=1 Tax=Pleuronectes platessa TaxID=8262 RepID=A0A9N7U5B4_PLEPL|nr:unnamed protein product [Pleuronectes platessa]